MYFVIDGQDATGKSTQVEQLASYLREHGREVITMHEPDGELESAHELRRLIKDKRYNLEAITHVLLFAAARAELWRKLAEPVLQRGGCVISARNWWSTLAYQGYGQGVSRSRIVRITKETMPAAYVQPAKALILTLPESLRLSRQSGRDDNSRDDTFESKPDDFQLRVNRAYLQIAKDYQIPILDASPAVATLQAQIRQTFSV